MNLTLKGKIFASRILLCGTVFIISIIMVFAPMFRISWQEKEYSIEYYLYTEYSVFDYFFADEIEVHFDVSEKQDEYIEDLLGTPTIKLQSIKAYEKKAVLWIAFIVDLVFIFTISRSRAIVKKRGPYIPKGKDPTFEKTKYEVFVCDDWFYLLIYSLPFLVLIPIFDFIAKTSYDFLCDLANTTPSSQIFDAFSTVINIQRLILIAIPFVISWVIDSFLIKPAIYNEIKKYGISHKKQLIGMPYLGSTSDYV